jgi:hypothetical protein
MLPLQRMQCPATFAAGVLLDQEKHEQKYKRLQLLEAQPDLDRQFKHGLPLVCAGVHANLLRVGFGGYEGRGFCHDPWSWPPNDAGISRAGDCWQKRPDGRFCRLPILKPNAPVEGRALSARPLHLKLGFLWRRKF